MPMSADQYRKLSTEELRRRYKQLDNDTSAYTMEAEMRRMYGLQEISEVLIERKAFP